MAAYSPFPTEVSQLNALPKAKKVFPRLGEVPSQVLQQAIKQLHRSSGGISENWAWIPQIQKVWAISVFVVSPVRKESNTRCTYRFAQTGVDSN